MASSKRITVTLPLAVVAAVQQRIEAGTAESFSGLVANVLTEHFQAGVPSEHFHHENLEQFLADLEAAAFPVDEKTRRDAEEWADAVWRSARGE